MIHLVLVRHNRRLSECLPKSIIDLLDSVETVWTDSTSGNYVDDINECFEFSGYQEGLARIIQNLKYNTNPVKCNSHRIIFANDTIFSGHIKPLAIFIFRCFLFIGSEKSSIFPRLTGIVTQNTAMDATITFPPRYVTTWLFMLEGSHEQLSRVYFYDPGLTLKNFIEKKYTELPFLYRQSVDEWLQPTHLLRGWYQAVPGRKLPPSTLNRKRFAIYLEHSLPSRMVQVGFEMCDLSQRIHPFKQKLLFVFRLIDRCYVNWIKLRFRLRMLTSNKRN